MPGQVSTYRINGGVTVPFRNAQKLEIEALFGVNGSASASVSDVEFADSTRAQNNTLLRQLQLQKPLEGVPVDIGIVDGADSITLDFFTDWNSLKFLAENQLSTGLVKYNSVIGFEQRSKAITFALLEFENILGPLEYQNMPYIIQNRKTVLERVQLVAQGFIVLKSAADEVHKIINIASDITTLGVVQATINLAVSIAALVLLIARLVALFKLIQESFFPPILYHSGIKPKVFIQKAVEYMGYDGVNFGTLQYNMDRETWCPSKNDEQGIPVDFVNPISGALKPNDKGYNLFDMMDVLDKKYRMRKAIIDNVIHFRPKSDPFWVNSPSLTMPNVLIEQAFTGNGTQRYNYDDLYTSSIVQYATDDSDKWTLQDLADENDPTSKQKIIAGSIVTPNVITDNKRVISKQGRTFDLPQTLCTRKDVLDDLLDIFIGTSQALDDLKQMVTDRFDEFAADLGTLVPGLESFIVSAGGRTGAMKIENHFFSTMKCAFLEDTDIGFGVTSPRIPEDFAEHIGAKALVENWHSYDSLVPGVRNPSDVNDTNAKLISEEVRIHFNLKKFNVLLNNPYFSIPGGGVGEFTRLKWNVEGDYAVADFWVPFNWLTNVQQITI